MFPEREHTRIQRPEQWETDNIEFGAAVSDLFQQSYNYIHIPTYTAERWGRKRASGSQGQGALCADLLTTFEPVQGLFPEELLSQS